MNFRFFFFFLFLLFVGVFFFSCALRGFGGGYINEVNEEREKPLEKPLELPPLSIKGIYFEDDKLVIVGSGVFMGKVCRVECTDMKLKPSILETRVSLAPKGSPSNARGNKNINNTYTIFLYGFGGDTAVLKVNFVERSVERIK